MTIDAVAPAAEEPDTRSAIERAVSEFYRVHGPFLLQYSERPTSVDGDDMPPYEFRPQWQVQYPGHDPLPPVGPDLVELLREITVTERAEAEHRQRIALVRAAVLSTECPPDQVLAVQALADNEAWCEQLWAHLVDGGVRA